MAGRRAIIVDIRYRTVVLDAGHCVGYPGVEIAYVEDGATVRELWLPVGDEPDDSDDEAVIAALHDAIVWREAGEPLRRPGQS